MAIWNVGWSPFYTVADGWHRRRDTGEDVMNRDPHTGLPMFDPPHADYYSKPSQPKYSHEYWYAHNSQSAAWVADRIEQDRNDAKRRIALQRQAYQEQHAVRHYFWLGRNAENF